MVKKVRGFFDILGCSFSLVEKGYGFSIFSLMDVSLCFFAFGSKYLFLRCVLFLMFFPVFLGSVVDFSLVLV